MSGQPLPQVSREIGVHVDVVGTLHLLQVIPVAHGHHAVDAEETHELRPKLLPLTLLLGRLGCPPDHSCLLQISDLGWEGTPGMAGGRRDLTPRNAPMRTKGFQRPQIISTRKRLFSTLPGAFRSSSVETNNTGVGGNSGKGASFLTDSAPTREGFMQSCFFESNMRYH